MDKNCRSRISSGDAMIKMKERELWQLIDEYGNMLVGGFPVPGKIVEKIERSATLLLQGSKANAYLTNYKRQCLDSYTEQQEFLQAGQYAQSRKCDIGEGVLGQVALCGQCCRVEDQNNNTLCCPIAFPNSWAAQVADGPEDEQGQIILGVVAVERAYPFTDSDEALLTKICTFGAMWLIHMLVLQEETISRRASEAVLNVIRQSYEGQDLVPIINSIAEQAQYITEAEKVSLLFVDEYMGELWVAGGAGEDAASLVGLQIPSSADHLLGYVAKHGVIMSCGNVRSDPFWGASYVRGGEVLGEQIWGADQRSVLCVPIPYPYVNEEEEVSDRDAEGSVGFRMCDGFLDSSPTNQVLVAARKKLSVKSPSRGTCTKSANNKAFGSASKLKSCSSTGNNDAWSDDQSKSRSTTEGFVEVPDNVQANTHVRRHSGSGGISTRGRETPGILSNSSSASHSDFPHLPEALANENMLPSSNSGRNNFVTVAELDQIASKTFIQMPHRHSKSVSPSATSSHDLIHGRSSSAKPLAIMVLVNKRGGELFDDLEEEILMPFCKEVESVLRRKAVEAMLMKRALCERRQARVNMASKVNTILRHSGKNGTASEMKLANGSLSPPSSGPLAGLRIESAIISQYAPIQRFSAIGKQNSCSMRTVSRSVTDSSPRRLGKLLVEAFPSELERLDLDVFNLADEEMFQFVHTMFHEFEMFDKYNINETTLASFVRAVHANYQNDNPFHNFKHGFSVMHITYSMLKHGAVEYLFSLDILAALIGSLCHDIGHPGNNNAFEVNSMSDLALTHSDDAVLERHHIHRTFEVLLMEENDIVKDLRENKRPRFQELRRSIVKIILMTDMSRHGEHVTLLSDRAQRITDALMHKSKHPARRYGGGGLKTPSSTNTPPPPPDTHTIHPPKNNRQVSNTGREQDQAKVMDKVYSPSPTPKNSHSSETDILVDPLASPGGLKVLWSSSPKPTFRRSSSDTKEITDLISNEDSQDADHSPSSDRPDSAGCRFQRLHAMRLLSSPSSDTPPPAGSTIPVQNPLKPRGLSTACRRHPTPEQNSTEPVQAFDREKPEDRLLLLAALVHCADLSGQLMPKDLALEWGRRVLSEFQAQAEKEDRLGLPMTFSKESTELELIQGQTFFLTKILEPLFTPLVQIFPDLKEFMKNLRNNREYYAEVTKSLEKKSERIAQKDILTTIDAKTGPEIAKILPLMDQKLSKTGVIRPISVHHSPCASPKGAGIDRYSTSIKPESRTLLGGLGSFQNKTERGSSLESSRSRCEDPES